GGFEVGNGELLSVVFSSSGGTDGVSGGLAMLKARTEGHGEALSDGKRWSEDGGHGGAWS
ncbi:hypothetical protein E2562_017133, partial [Oryza meyeriana var. granulata]